MLRTGPATDVSSSSAKLLLVPARSVSCGRHDRRKPNCESQGGAQGCARAHGGPYNRRSLVPVPGLRMTAPTADIFRAVLANQGISLPPDLLEVAIAQHARLRPGLEELRAIPLSYLELIEPAMVSRWIENEGRSPSGS